MERLTAHSKQTSHENGICCTHFLGFECIGVGGNCARNCKWEEAAWSRLAAYEDSGCAPEEVLPKDKADEIALKLMRLADLENFAVTPACGSWPRPTRTVGWWCCRARRVIGFTK